MQRQESLPKLKISQLEFEFRRVFYKIPQEQVMTITNIGKSVCVFSIVYDKVFTWLSFSYQHGSIQPGESLDIMVRVLFKEKEAQRANYICKYKRANTKFRIVDGMEENLEVNSDFVGSCFGCNFKELAKILGPISELEGNIKENSQKIEGITQVPKELFRIVEFITSNSIEGMFEKSWDEDVVAQIRVNLDSFEPFVETADCNSMVFVLIEMLETMPAPLISPVVLDEIIKETPISSGQVLKQAISSKIDGISMKSFEYLLDLFKWMVEMNPKLLDYIIEHFMYAIFHIKRITSNNMRTDSTRRQFFTNMIVR